MYPNYVVWLSVDVQIPAVIPRKTSFNRFILFVFFFGVYPKKVYYISEVREKLPILLFILTVEIF